LPRTSAARHSNVFARVGREVPGVRQQDEAPGRRRC
jgi:hypothetical protein